MYDLDIKYSDGRTGAVEVTSATHAEETQFWKLATSGDRWTDPRLIGGWLVQASTSASVKRLRIALPPVLAELERLNLHDLNDHRALGLHTACTQLGVVSARQSGTDYPGSIYLLPRLPAEKSGGAVPDHSDGLATWLTMWVSSAICADNVAKLRRAETDERHLFVFVPTFSTAPFEVQYLLLDSVRPLPTEAPRVPAQISDIWATGTMTAGLGYRWTNGRGWSNFDRRVNKPDGTCN